MNTQEKTLFSIRILAGLVVVIGTLNLIGWYFGIIIFTQLIQGLTPMMFNTGLCFFVSGLCLFLLTHNFIWSVRILSLIPFTLSLLTLIQYFFNLQLNIDNLLYQIPPHSLVHFQGRMAPSTALNFLLTSLCLTFIVTNFNRARNWIGSCCASIIFSLGSISFIGYLFGIPQKSFEYLQYSSFDTLMAYHTGFAFMILGTGIYLSTLAFTNKGKFASWSLVPIALASLSIQINLWNMIILENKILEAKGLKDGWELYGLLFLFFLVIFLTIYLIYRFIQITFLLETAKIQMQSTSENRGRLLNHVSHEIKNPLNAIMGFSALLLEKKSEGEEKQTLESIQSSAAHILNLTKDLLAITRLEEGNIELNEVEFKLHPWIDEVIALTASRAKLKKINFISQLDDRIPEVIIGDYSKIAQIIFNLIDNALKFTPHEKSITFYLNYIPLSNNEFILDIAVKDSGPGVPLDAKKQIFEPYSQMQTFQKGEGSGLGLSICTAYSKMMRGDIGVSNNDDEGATFFSKVRLKKPVQDTTEQNSPKN